MSTYSIHQAPNSLQAQLIGSYQGLLGRLPDQVGFETWSAAIQTSGTVQTFINAQIIAPEFANLYGAANPTNSSWSSNFVTSTYYNFLGRQPTTTELNSYTNNLVSGRLTVAQYVTNNKSTSKWIEETIYSCRLEYNMKKSAGRERSDRLGSLNFSSFLYVNNKCT